jgi:hypothetical protein
MDAEYLKNKYIVDNWDRLNVFHLTDGTGPRMQALKTRAEEYLKNHADNMKRFFINKVRGLIEWSIQEFENAKQTLKANIDKYRDLILYWAPERVLAVQKYFGVMKAALQNFELWNMLDRKERRFIIKALEFAEGKR